MGKKDDLGGLEAAAPSVSGEGSYGGVVARCGDCGLSCDDDGWADLVVSHRAFRSISPTGDENGLFCPNCMVRRAQRAGLHGIDARFRSGPFATTDGWLPIESAPRDGTEILAWHPNDDVHCVAWDVDETNDCWAQTVGPAEHRWDSDAFEYWQPRPAPPALEPSPPKSEAPTTIPPRERSEAQTTPTLTGGRW